MSYTIKSGIGKTVHLNGLDAIASDSAFDSFEAVTLTGDYTIEDYEPADASMHISEPLVILVKDGDPLFYEVSADELWRHIDPEGAAKQDRLELEWELYELEEWYKESGNPLLQSQIDELKLKLAPEDLTGYPE